MLALIKTFIRKLLGKPTGYEVIGYLRYKGYEKIVKGGVIVKDFPEEIKQEMTEITKSGLTYAQEIEIKKIPVY